MKTVAKIGSDKQLVFLADKTVFVMPDNKRIFPREVIELETSGQLVWANEKVRTYVYNAITDTEEIVTLFHTSADDLDMSAELEKIPDAPMELVDENPVSPEHVKIFMRVVIVVMSLTALIGTVIYFVTVGKA